MTTLYIDADACPVRAEAQSVAARHGVEVYVVSNGGIRPSPDPKVHTVVVDGGADAADKWIAERTGPGDVCVTADIVLADNVLKTGARVLKPNGEALTSANIGQVLAMRDLMADLRAANPLGAGGGQKPFSRADRSRFLEALERTLRAASRETS
ncbi:MAG: YaiI/YqxD family protein [Pseudomonadota bacterium]